MIYSPLAQPQRGKSHVDQLDPGEGHGIMKYKNRRAKMEWDLAWLDRYVMGKKK